jgi:pimeloyl-ACP methyl ester carboxylesterase
MAVGCGATSQIDSLHKDIGCLRPPAPGCGERLHLTGPEVGLETHISDIVNVIEYEELSNVILVGHSFSGITITGVADRLRERIERIVFFDALVPRPGRMSGVTKGPHNR